MHPPRIEHARSLHVLVAVCLFGGAVLGCSSSPDVESAFLPPDTIATAVERDSAISVLSSTRRAPFDSAFSALGTYSVTRSVRTEQRAPDGAVTAIRSYVLRYAPGAEPGTLLRQDSTGAFRSGGLLGRAAPARNPRDRPTDVAEQILPDEPAYVEPRTREAYRYALQADTLHDTPVYVLEARARDRGTGRDQNVRFARLLLEQDSRTLIGLTVVRAGRVLLFEENSRMRLQLRRAPDGTWVPHVSRIRASVTVPFRTPRQFRTVSAYYDYDPSPAE